MSAIRAVDRVQDLADWNQPSFADGQYAVWNAATGKFVGGSVSVPVTSVFGRTGAVSLTSSDVTTALGYSDIARTGVSNTFTLSNTFQNGLVIGSSSAQSQVTYSNDFTVNNQNAGYGVFFGNTGGGGLIYRPRSGLGLGKNDGLSWNSTDTGVAGAGDVLLFRDAAGTLAQRNGTNAQVLRVYNTYTDASNGEWGELSWSSNTCTIQTTKNGTGSGRTLIISGGSGSVFLQSNGSNRLSIGSSVSLFANLIAATDNTYDIGAAGGNRPSNIYVATAIKVSGSGSTFGGTDNRGVLTVQTSNTSQYAANTDPADAGRFFVMQNNDTSNVGNQFSNITLQIYPTASAGFGRCLADIRLIRETAGTSNSYFLWSGFSGTSGWTYTDWAKIGRSSAWFVGSVTAVGNVIAPNIIYTTAMACIG